MGLFDFLKNKQPYTREQIGAKTMAALKAYKERNFTLAAQLFSEYFEMKGFGNYPEMDVEDGRMYVNLMLCQFYGHDYSACKKTCDILINMGSFVGDAYAFSAMCSYKLNDKETADKLWGIATVKGCELTQYYSKVSEVKMQGFN